MEHLQLDKELLFLLVLVEQLQVLLPSIQLALDLLLVQVVVSLKALLINSLVLLAQQEHMQLSLLVSNFNNHRK